MNALNEKIKELSKIKKAMNNLEKEKESLKKAV